MFPGTASEASAWTILARPCVPGRISNLGSKSTIVAASLARIEEAEVAVDDRPGVVRDRSVVAAANPPLLEALGKLVDVVDLTDRDALVGQMEHLVVEVGVEIPLSSETLLNPVIPPTGPMVRVEHHAC